MSDYEKEIVNDLVGKIKAAGFRAFVAERGTYGFFTDADGTQVISFGVDLGTVTVSGNYKTDRPRETGTGWVIEKTVGDVPDVKALFDQYPPRWATGDAKWSFTTLDRHL
jgi:hypothetical protein